MNVVGIICEFNPFHSGHKYLIDSVRRDLNPDAVVCVMSGDFVQRGEAALWDKYTRANWALACGADLVLELPYCFAVNGAANFARGGIRILKGLGCVNYLAFGCESGTSKDFEKAAYQLTEETSDFKAVMKIKLKSGVSYPEAYAAAAKVMDIDFDLISKPNNVLGLEYLKANIKQNANLKAFAVKRIGAGHDSMIDDEESISASKIREMVKNGESDKLISFLPFLATRMSREKTPREKLTIDSNFEHLALRNYFGSDAEKRYFDLVRYELITRDIDELKNILEVDEGLENSLVNAVRAADSLDGLINEVKSKRYTYGRISRILNHVVMGLDKESFAQICRNDEAYAKVLSFNERGAYLITKAKIEGDIPIYSNINKDAKYSRLLEYDIKAADIYNLLRGRKMDKFSDRVCIPRINAI